jgi:hypothetical protein
MSKRSASLVLALLLVWLIVASALAAVRTNGYMLERWTLDNGGGVSATGRYSLIGTIGQLDASKGMTGETYSLTGGYWGVFRTSVLFLPVVLR